MKNYILIASTSLVMIVGCQNPMADEKVIQQRDSLLSVISERDNSVDDFINSFNEVEGNLNTITNKQNIIVITPKKEILNQVRKNALIVKFRLSMS